MFSLSLSLSYTHTHTVIKQCALINNSNSSSVLQGSFSPSPFRVTAHFSGSEKSVEPVLTTVLSQPCMYSPDSLIHFGIISCHSKWQPTPVFLPGKSHIWRRLVGYSLWGRKELDTTERLHSLTCHSKASLYTHTDDRSQST